MVNVDDITSERVRQVLRHLARERTPGRTILAELEVVRRALEDAGFYPTPAAREYELGRLLVELVERELGILRRRAALAVAPDRPEQVLQADFALGLRELESWSAVYHLYLRPDLDLTLKGFTDFLDDRHRRTIQRRLRRGVAALANRLQAAERAARLASATERSAAHLPPPPAARLVGVEGLMGRLSGRLREPAAARVLALAGPGGIGKTALAQALVRRSLEDQAFDAVVWVGGDGGPAGSAEGLRAAIAGQLVEGAERPLSPGEARARLWRRPTLVVVDGIDEPARAAAALEALGLVGGPSRALVTGRVGWGAWPGVEVLDVPALDAAAAAALLRSEVDRRGLGDVAGSSEAALAPLVSATAGHPLAIRLAAGQLRADEPDNVAVEFASGEGAMAQLLRELWAPAWRRLSPPARAVVRAACAAEAQPARRAELAQATGLAGAAFTNALAEALDAGLLGSAPLPGQRGYRPGLFLPLYLRRVR